MSYYLIADDETEVADLLEFAITSKFGIDIVVTNSGKAAIDIINEKGIPELIISDFHMPNGDGVFIYTTLQNRNINCPFVICSREPVEELKKKFPGIYGYLEKPDVIEDLLLIISSFVQHSNLTSTSVKPNYVPIRIELLMRIGQLASDIYMRLSDEKYVKIANKGDSFLPSDAEKFDSKKLKYLFVSKGDCEEFIKSFQLNIESISSAKKIPPHAQLSFSLESLEIVERLSSVLGWSPQVVGAAKKSIQLAVGVIGNDPDLFKIFQKKLANPDSPYMQHTAPLAMIACVFCHQLGWTSDSTQLKLAMTALMHDMSVDDSYYPDVTSWNQLAKNSKEKSPKIEKYKNHPFDAAQLSLRIKHLPPDVDQIILQHHEAPNCGGFPRGLSSGRISPMSALFIIAEDLLHFIGDEEENILKKLFDFVVTREALYREGSFKRVFVILKQHLNVSNQ